MKKPVLTALLAIIFTFNLFAQNKSGAINFINQTLDSGIVTRAQVKSSFKRVVDFADSTKMRANHTGTQPISATSGLQTALDGKVNIADTSNLLKKTTAAALYVQKSTGQKLMTNAESKRLSGLVKIPRRVVLLGDSRSDMCGGPRLNGTTQSYLPLGYWTYANILSGHRFDLVMNAGISGDNVANFAARFNTDVTPYTPDIVVVYGGWNDLGTWDSGNYNTKFATLKANFLNIFNKIDSIGAVGVVCTETPVSFNYPNLNATKLLALSDLNSFLKQTCRNRRGLVLADIGNAYLDPTTTFEPYYGANGHPEYNTDGLHPSASGAYMIGKVLAKAMVSIAPEGNMLHSGQGAANKVVNSHFIGVDTVTTLSTFTNSTAIIPSWTFYNNGPAGTVGVKYVPRTGDYPGNWLQVNTTSTGYAILRQTISTGFATGDKVKFTIEYEDVTPSGGAGMIAAEIQTRLANTTAIETLGDDSDGNMDAGGLKYVDYRINLGKGVLETPPITWTSTTSTILLTIKIRNNVSGVKVKLGRATCVKIN